MSGRLSPHKFEMCSIRPYQDYSFRCWFSNNSVLAFVVSVLPQDLVFSSFIPYHCYFCSGGFVMLLSSTHHLGCQDHVQFLPLSLEVLPKLYHSFPLYLVLTGVSYEFVLPCSSSLPECFQLCSTSLHSYFQVVQLLKILWFHSFVKGAT